MPLHGGTGTASVVYCVHSSSLGLLYLLFECVARAHHLAPDEHHAVRDTKGPLVLHVGASRCISMYLALLCHQQVSRESHCLSFCKRLIAGTD